MVKKKKKFALKTAAAVTIVVLFFLGISIATGLLRIDIVASTISSEVPANYHKEEKIETNLMEGKHFVLFTSSWCGPCQTLSNFYKLSAKKYSNIDFIEADIEINRALANELGATLTPSVLFIQDGRVISNTEVGIDDIEKSIDKYASL